MRPWVFMSIIVIYIIIDTTADELEPTSQKILQAYESNKMTLALIKQDYEEVKNLIDNFSVDEGLYKSYSQL